MSGGVTPAHQPHARDQTKKATASGWIGSALEYYDFFIYATAASQGFAVAGEISGSSCMILEHAPFGRRAFFASFTLQGVQAGQILAAAVFLPLAAFMPADAFNAWGWRVPFLLSVVVIIAGYIIRR